MNHGLTFVTESHGFVHRDRATQSQDTPCSKTRMLLAYARCQAFFIRLASMALTAFAA